jgi:plastocyanin
MRNYDHDIGPTTSVVPVAAHDGPPPGVHMPGPSWRPFLGAFGLFAVMLGLVFGEWVLAAGIIVFISTVIGWLFDAVAEYRQTVKADTTGHLENIPEAKSPRLLLSALTVLIVGAAVLQSGLFVGSSANGGTPGASGAPTGSGAPAGSGGPARSGGLAGSGGPPAGGATGDVSVQAKGVAFVETTWTGPAGKPFTIAFDNEDAGTPHNIEILDASGATVFKGDIFPGVATKIYNVPALTAGSYKFLCVVHPTIMTGTATIQ